MDARRSCRAILRAMPGNWPSLHGASACWTGRRCVSSSTKTPDGAGSRAAADFPGVPRRAPAGRGGPVDACSPYRPADRARFAQLLCPTWTVGTAGGHATPDFSTVWPDPDLTALPTQVSPLRPLRREALRTVIEKPSRLAGSTGRLLVDRLVDDTEAEKRAAAGVTLASLSTASPWRRRWGSRYDHLGVSGRPPRQLSGTRQASALGVECEEVIAGLLRRSRVRAGPSYRWRSSAPIARAVITGWSLRCKRRL